MSKSIVFTFGRFQSPSIGHAKLINKTVSLAKETGAEHKIYPSKSQDNSKNPIPYKDKVGYLRSLFPHANVEDDPHAHTAFHVAKSLSDQGYKHVTMVVGQDRVGEFQKSIGKYVKKDTDPDFDPKKHYNFDSFKVVSAGDRDEKAGGVAGASGTKMRQWAKEGNFKDFASNTPTTNLHLSRKIFNSVKKNLSESVENGHEAFRPEMNKFVDFASGLLDLKTVPNIQFTSPDGSQPSFGGYNPSTKEIVLHTKSRHPMDIFRTLAHELVHHKQNEDGRLGDLSVDGATGSDIENEANSMAGVVMRKYGKSAPDAFHLQHVTESVDISEGLNDPAIFKAVFLAGGPGSGKDYVLKNTLQGHGLVEINSDIALEFLMKKNNLSLTMPDSELARRNLVRGQAKNLMQEKQRLALIGRLGLIINGTADDPSKVARIKSGLEQIGYDTMMVFVDTSDHISKARNIERGKNGGRTVPEDIRKQKWELAQNNRETIHKLFGDNFVSINNDADLRTASDEVKNDVQKEFTKVYKQVQAFIKHPPSSGAAIDWYENEIERQHLTKKAPKMIVQKKSLSQKFADKVLREEKKETKLTLSQAFQNARQSGSFAFNFEGKKYHTRKAGEFTDDWMKELEANRHANPKAQVKIQLKTPPKSKAEEANTTIPVIKDAVGNPMNHVIAAHRNKMNNRINEDLTLFLETGGAGDWGTDKLRKKYEKETPNEEVENVVAGVGIGPEEEDRMTPNFAVVESQLPKDTSIREWAMKESTQKRFAQKYGIKAPEKLLETAKNLASHKY